MRCSGSIFRPLGLKCERARFQVISAFWGKSGCSWLSTEVSKTFTDPSKRTHQQKILLFQGSVLAQRSNLEWGWGDGQGAPLPLPPSPLIPLKSKQAASPQTHPLKLQLWKTGGEGEQMQTWMNVIRSRLELDGTKQSKQATAWSRSGCQSWTARLLKAGSSY